MKEKDDEEGNRYMIKCLNVQGLTNQKYAEIFGEMGEKVVMCLTETQKKVNNIRTGKHLEVIESMRDIEDRKGGGLMVLYEEKEDLSLEKKDGGHRDCLEMTGKFGREKVNLTVVYLKTGNGREELEQNREILGEMRDRVREADEKGESYIAVGDSNGHLGYLGYQDENENGKSINKMLEESGLILMNVDEKCEGKFTWMRGDSKSAIDLVVAKEKAFGSIKKMKIDEKQEKLDISDHCMIEIEFVTGRMERKIWNGWVEGGYYSSREEKIVEYKREVEREIVQSGNRTLQRINEIIRKVADEQLKIKYRRRICEAEKKEEPPWMNEEIRRESAKRMKINKRHRYAAEERQR